ncbi:hypothetical protein [Candidatus Vampirococcus lugosii]|nr:hypothetical protein [Candidatus Vampirococcus lugosii]
MKKEDKFKIEKSLFLKQETKDKLINNWEKLDSFTKYKILKKVKESSDLEHKLFNDFFEKNKEPEILIKQKLNKIKQNQVRKIEEISSLNADLEIEDKLNNI